MSNPYEILVLNLSNSYVTKSKYEWAAKSFPIEFLMRSLSKRSYTLSIR